MGAVRRRWQKGKSNSELAGVVHRQGQVIVAGGKDVGMDLDRIEALGAAQYAHDDLVQQSAGDHEAAALHGPGGDFDEASWRDMA